MLQLIAPRPEWAARLPLDLIDGETAEGAALLEIIDLVTHGRLVAGGYGMLLEAMRGTPHEGIIAGLAEALAGTSDNAEAESVEAVFNDAVAHLQHALIAQEIEQLTARARTGLSAEERARLALLLARKQGRSVLGGGIAG